MTYPQIHLITDFTRLSKMLLKGQIFCALDTEATGLKISQSRIIEIALVRFDQTGILDSFSTLINPCEPLNSEITELTHITEEMLSGESEFRKKAESIKNFLSNSVLLAHNAHFDIKLLNKELSLIDEPPVNNLVIDTLSLSRWAYPENVHWTLQYLASQFNLNSGNPHRAYDDAMTCRNLFLQCLKDTKNRQKPFSASEKE